MMVALGLKILRTSSNIIPKYAFDSYRQIVRKLATRYTVCGGDLCKKSFNHMLLRCLTEEEAHQVVQDVHAGIWGGHVHSQMLAKKNLRQSYDWATIEKDSYAYIRKCHKC
ncbi:hypothetical protein AMTR_s00065p00126840 [Amborella trichopoda]|uniref:Integrase zinc-binding domain-containing protein n=1 Tax=Amborella trichopoda TaxID=13333 RepID=U5DAY4_AMBTC|nr:hypothetical protein AMTR_s00065p00126840 [Amborella trichopoda]